jgi:hypothetical protein
MIRNSRKLSSPPYLPENDARDVLHRTFDASKRAVVFRMRVCIVRITFYSSAATDERCEADLVTRTLEASRAENAMEWKANALTGVDSSLGRYVFQGRWPLLPEDDTRLRSEGSSWRRGFGL